MAGPVRLYPFAIDNELRNGALADVAEHLFQGSGGGADIDFRKCDGMPFEEALGFSAIPAPSRSVKDQIHHSI